LLYLRFGQALVIRKQFDDVKEKQYLIPPTSAFVAFENAVKHNEISEQHPLQIEVSIENDSLIITNSVRERKSRDHSSKIGLKNLEERFRLITGKGISTQHLPDEFRLSMPMIGLDQNEV
jgi:LytS/YehU family sensor histidine kinase